MNDLRDASVVVTGASSGIGRATAIAFAREGARTTLAARREPALRDVARACAEAGTPAHVVPTDVTDAAAVERLAREASRVHGGIDVCVNNAGVGLFGPFAEARIEAHRRVVETNLFGTMNGAAAVLPYFFARSRGVMINNISIGGWVPVPFAAAYAASKFGLRAFTASLRQELHDWPDIRVCGLFPAAIDTPGYVHGANVSGRALEVSGPLHAPEEVADAIVRLAKHPRDEVSVGLSADLARLGYGIAPALAERIVGAVFRRYVAGGRPAAATEGNLFEPVTAGTEASGGMRSMTAPRPATTRTALAIGAGVVGVGLLFAARRARGT